MERVLINIQAGMFMRVNITMITNMEMDQWNLWMGMSILDNGIKIISMEVADIFLAVNRSFKVYFILEDMKEMI